MRPAEGGLAESVKNLSKSAVETLVRDEKFARENSNGSGRVEVQNGLFEPISRPESLPGQTLKLSTEVQERLLELQEKGVDINQLLQEFLNQREKGIVQKKQEVSQKVQDKEKKLRQEGKEPSRYKSQAVEEILKEEYGTKCAVPGRGKLATETHHILAFAVGKTHDPKYLIPLCKGHHELQHSVNEQYRKTRRIKVEH